MALTSPFPGMVELGPSVYLYTPAHQAHEANISAPKLVILCAWMNAHPIHIKKYIFGYQALFPTATILLIRSSTLDVLYRSTAILRRRVEPALAVIRSICSPEPASPEILLHVFSNGGSHQGINLLRCYPTATGQVFPIHATILDSCPGRGNLKRSYLALTAPFERQPIYLRLLGSLFTILILCLYWVMIIPLGLENPIERIRQGLNDRSITRETKRVYIYSDVDPMVHWQEVEDHADDARKNGFVTRMEKFKGSGHAAHVRVGGGERYWRIAKDLWTQSTIDR